jgi:pantothenate kinase
MDGFHYYRTRLEQFEDPILAKKRRGAHWTFDAFKFVSRLESAKLSGFGLFPSFDHAIGDPVEDSIVLGHEHRVVFVEGLYLLLDIPPWNRIKGLLDSIFFLDVSEEVLIERLALRHKETMKLSDNDARSRAMNNDIPNASVVAECRDRADFILRS